MFKNIRSIPKRGAALRDGQNNCLVCYPSGYLVITTWLDIPGILYTVSAIAIIFDKSY